MSVTEGKGFKEIAHDLHRRGVLTRRGGPWTFASVRAILRNEVYTGTVSFNRRRFKNRKGDYYYYAARCLL